MNRKIIALLTFVIVSSNLNSSFAQLKKVRLAIPTVDIVTLPLKMAQAKGFYQKEGLEVEIILVIGALGVRAILGNSVEFSTASGSVLAAAARGVPVKRFDHHVKADVRSVFGPQDSVVPTTERQTRRHHDAGRNFRAYHPVDSRTQRTESRQRRYDSRARQTGGFISWAKSR